MATAAACIISLPCDTSYSSHKTHTRHSPTSSSPVSRIGSWISAVTDDLAPHSPVASFTPTSNSTCASLEFLGEGLHFLAPVTTLGLTSKQRHLHLHPPEVPGLRDCNSGLKPCHTLSTPYPFNTHQLEPWFPGLFETPRIFHLPCRARHQNLGLFAPSNTKKDILIARNVCLATTWTSSRSQPNS